MLLSVVIVGTYILCDCRLAICNCAICVTIFVSIGDSIGMAVCVSIGLFVSILNSEGLKIYK